MTVNEALQKWWDEDAERLNSMAEQAREFAVKTPKRKKAEDRGFCPNGKGGGVTNTCASEDKPATALVGDSSWNQFEQNISGDQSEGDKEPVVTGEDETQIISAEPFANQDAGLPRTEIVAKDGRSIPVITRDSEDTSEYLRSLESTAKSRGLVVNFDEAKGLQQASDIDEDIGPYAAFVRDGYVMLTDNGLGSESNTEETIDFNGAEFGTIDDESASEMREEKLTYIIDEAWERLDEDELKNEIEGWGELNEDERSAKEEEWKQNARESVEYTDEADQQVSDAREEARDSAVQQMRKQLERDLASADLACCVQLYRGLDLLDSDVERIIKEGIITHTSANSWTTSRSTAVRFSGSQVLLVCRNPAVGHVYQSNHSDEDEVTRPPSTMKVVGVVKTDGGTVLFVDEDDDYKDDDRDGVLDIYQK